MLCNWKILTFLFLFKQNFQVVETSKAFLQLGVCISNVCHFVTIYMDLEWWPLIGGNRVKKILRAKQNFFECFVTSLVSYGECLTGIMCITDINMSLV